MQFTHVTVENQRGSVEHYCHFLLGFLLPLAHHIATSPIPPGRFTVLRSCGPMDRILREVNFRGLLVADKADHRAMRRMFVANTRGDGIGADRAGIASPPRRPAIPGFGDLRRACGRAAGSRAAIELADYEALFPDAPSHRLWERTRGSVGAPLYRRSAAGPGSRSHRDPRHAHDRGHDHRIGRIAQIERGTSGLVDGGGGDHRLQPRDDRRRTGHGPLRGAERPRNLASRFRRQPRLGIRRGHDRRIDLVIDVLADAECAGSIGRLVVVRGGWEAGPAPAVTRNSRKPGSTPRAPVDRSYRSLSGLAGARRDLRRAQETECTAAVEGL